MNEVAYWLKVYFILLEAMMGKKLTYFIASDDERIEEIVFKFDSSSFMLKRRPIGLEQQPMFFFSCPIYLGSWTWHLQLILHVSLSTHFHLATSPSNKYYWEHNIMWTIQSMAWLNASRFHICQKRNQYCTKSRWTVVTCNLLSRNGLWFVISGFSRSSYCWFFYFSITYVGDCVFFRTFHLESSLWCQWCSSYLFSHVSYHLSFIEATLRFLLSTLGSSYCDFSISHTSRRVFWFQIYWLLIFLSWRSSCFKLLIFHSIVY